MILRDAVCCHCNIKSTPKFLISFSLPFFFLKKKKRIKDLNPLQSNPKIFIKESTECVNSWVLLLSRALWKLTTKLAIYGIPSLNPAKQQCISYSTDLIKHSSLGLWFGQIVVYQIRKSFHLPQQNIIQYSALKKVEWQQSMPFDGGFSSYSLSLLYHLGYPGLYYLQE